MSMHVAQFSGVAVTAQQDFFEVLAPSDAVIKVYRWHISQSTEVGDAAEEGLSIKTVRGVGSVTSGSGGSTPTAHPVQNGDATSGATVEANNTTKMVVGTGTLETLGSYNWNIRVPLDMVYLPEERPIISPGDRFTVELATTPADSITASGYILFEEIGG